MKIIIARHGNTFAPGDVIRRIGSRTDLPLVESGIRQARDLGIELKKKYGTPSALFCGELARLKEFAKIVSKTFDGVPAPKVDSRFNELDYGQYDGMPEDEFVKAVGKEALNKWDEFAIPAADWGVNPELMGKMWQAFASEVASGAYGSFVVVVTSNGTARFAPRVFTPGGGEFSLKLSTGAYGLLELGDEGWKVVKWNIKPHATMDGGQR